MGLHGDAALRRRSVGEESIPHERLVKPGLEVEVPLRMW